MTANPRRASLAAATLCLATFSCNASAGDWSWDVAPYLWFIGVNVDMHLENPPPGSGDVSFDNLLDDLDGAFQAHAEGQGDTWGMFADITYFGLASDNDFTGLHSEADLDSRMFELAAVWSPGEERFRGFEAFAGLRYINVDTTVDLIPTDPAFADTNFKSSETFNDFMIGARYTFELSDRFGLTLRGDGSFGDTDGWNASAVASYRTEHGAWFFGYRYMSLGLDTENRHFDLALSGPELGYGFKF